MVGAVRRCKGEPKTRKTVHLCGRAVLGTPPQALRQWSCPHAAAKVNPKRGKRFTFATGQHRERRYRRCGNGRVRTPLQRCTGIRENGSPLQQGSTWDAATGSTAMVRSAHRCKGVPKMRENGSPLQPGNAGNATTGPVEMVWNARHCKGVPKMRENGSPLQLGNTGNAATGAVAMVGAARHCKGEPKTRKTVHLCNRAVSGTPLQTLQQWY